MKFMKCRGVKTQTQTPIEDEFAKKPCKRVNHRQYQFFITSGPDQRLNTSVYIEYIKLEYIYYLSSGCNMSLQIVPIKKTVAHELTRAVNGAS